MARWMVLAWVLLLPLPLSAAAAQNCRGQQTHPAAAHAAHAESVENIPAGRAAASCPGHSGEPRAISADMMPGCVMEGCCIKADGPLSTGLSNRPPANDDTAESVCAVRPVAGGRLVDAAPHRLHPQRILPGPNPRPPGGQSSSTYRHFLQSRA